MKAGLRFNCIFILVCLATSCARAPDHFKRVSLYELLANGSVNDECKVVVFGFIQSQKEAKGLFPTREAARYGDYKSGIWINCEEMTDEWDGKWVMTRGTYSSKEHGHGGAYAGTINDAVLYDAEPPLHGQ